jgi:hypothetical protein
MENTNVQILGEEPPEPSSEEELLEKTIETVVEDTSLNLPREKRRVYSDKSDRSIYELERRQRRGDLNLDPEFQRNYVWDDKKASLLVESVLLEIPIPVIYLAEEPDGKFTIIDGQQRLRSFFRFFNNEFKLKGLKVLSDHNGKIFKNLDEESKKKIEDATIRTIEIRKETPPEVKFEIFERLNVGAVKLNEQELRNCIYRGKYNNLIRKLSENKNELPETRDFLQLLGLDEPQKRMQQREMVLHFLAFYNQTYTKYRPPMKQFLNKEMEENKNITEEKLNEAHQAFKDAISLAKTVFGTKAFRRFTSGNESNRDGKWENRINMGLFEIILYGFSKYKKNQIIQSSDAIREELINLMASNENFINCISGTGTTNTDKVNLRFRIWEETLEKLVGVPKTEPRLFSPDFKRQLYDQNSKCDICGNKIMLFEDATVDHIDPYCNGGKTTEGNARLAHRYCNSRRGGNKAVSSP